MSVMLTIHSLTYMSTASLVRPIWMDRCGKASWFSPRSGSHCTRTAGLPEILLSNPSCEPTTVIEKLTENQLQSRIDREYWT